MSKWKAWNDKLDEGNSIGWQKWMHDLQKLRYFTISHWLKPDSFGYISNVQLYNFCGASCDVYDAVSYIRIVGEDEMFMLSFCWQSLVYSQDNYLTIGAVRSRACNQDACLSKERNTNFIQPNLFWQIAWSSFDILGVGQSGFRPSYQIVWPRYMTYLALKTDDMYLQKWILRMNISGGDADYISQWIEGPNFLLHPMETWPKTTQIPDLSSEDCEVKREATVHVTAVAANVEDNPVHQLLKRYSSWPKLCKSLSKKANYSP